MKIFKKSIVYDNLQGKRIGVTGLSPRCGTTHVAVAISNYLSDVARKKVCLIERSGHEDLKYLTDTLGGTDGGEASGVFSYHRVSYVCSGTKEAAALVDSSFDCTVFDLGSDIGRSMSTLCLCDYRIVVGASAPWCRTDYEILSKIAGKAGELTNWRLFVNLGDAALSRTYARAEMETFCFPFEADPIFPGEETKKILQSALN